MTTDQKKENEEIPNVERGDLTVEQVTDESAILTRIAHADKSAVQDCVNLYGNMIWALAKQFTDSNSDAEKAASEIFMDIWKNAEFCDLGISDETVWIALIARQRLKNYSEKVDSQTSPENAKGFLSNHCPKVQTTMMVAR